MNDILWLYLDFEPNDEDVVDRINVLLDRIDELLQEYGWKYTGLNNIYCPIPGTDCDATWHQAEEALQNAEWLKKYSPHVRVGTHTNVCDVNEIIIRGMSLVCKEKMLKYSAYYERKRKFAHGIIVDENNVLRDGYTTYLLAKRDGGCPEIMRVKSDQVFKKIVIGKIVKETENGLVETSKKTYTWYCDLRSAVVPGDILYAKAKNNRVKMRVDKVSYVAEPYLCTKHKNVIKHAHLEKSGDM